MPKRKTSIGPQQLDCSDGAKMLIDQMKEHPEEFRGYAGTFRSMLEMALDVARGAARNMSKRDAAAIMGAAETHLYEVWLAEDVLTQIMQPKEEPVQYREAMRLDSSGTLGIGIRAPGKSFLQGAGTPKSMFVDDNATASQYEQVYQIEVAKYKAELEKLRQQDLEHARRNTKPFKFFP